MFNVWLYFVDLFIVNVFGKRFCDIDEVLESDVEFIDNEDDLVIFVVKRFRKVINSKVY